jgi:hypothetical protein
MEHPSSSPAEYEAPALHVAGHLAELTLVHHKYLHRTPDGEDLVTPCGVFVLTS